MDQVTYNAWSVGIQIAAAIVSLIAVIILWFYTVETHKLRKTGEQQVSLFREQMKSSVKPCVVGNFGVYIEPKPARLHGYITQAGDRPALQIFMIASRQGEHFLYVHSP